MCDYFVDRIAMTFRFRRGIDDFRRRKATPRDGVEYRDAAMRAALLCRSDGPFIETNGLQFIDVTDGFVKRQINGHFRSTRLTDGSETADPV